MFTTEADGGYPQLFINLVLHKINPALILKEVTKPLSKL